MADDRLRLRAGGSVLGLALRAALAATSVDRLRGADGSRSRWATAALVLALASLGGAAARRS